MSNIMGQIKLDKVRNLKFNSSAIRRFENALGKPYASITWDNLFLEEFYTIIWAALVWEDPELTVDKIFELVDDYSSDAEMNEAFMKMMEASNPPAEKVKGGTKNAKRA
jgi:hypothetical protein